MHFKYRSKKVAKFNRHNPIWAIVCYSVYNIEEDISDYRILTLSIAYPETYGKKFNLPQ